VDLGSRYALGGDGAQPRGRVRPALECGATAAPARPAPRRFSMVPARPGAIGGVK
jgi:hypothetical protein